MFEMTWHQAAFIGSIVQGHHVTRLTHDFTHDGSRASKPRASVFTFRYIFWPNMAVVSTL
jgi:hypothetical protein